MIPVYKLMAELGQREKQASKFEKIASVHLVIITARVKFQCLNTVVVMVVIFFFKLDGLDLSHVTMLMFLFF